MLSVQDFTYGYNLLNLCMELECKEELKDLGKFLYKTLVDYETKANSEEDIMRKREKVESILLSQETE